MTKTRRAAIVFATLVAALVPNAARAECSLENIASAEEIAGGWTINEDHRIVKQVDGAPYKDGSGNWFVDRETTMMPICSAFDELGQYSLRGYMLPLVITKSSFQICRATLDGGSVPFVPANAKPKPADSVYEVYSPYDRPYAGSCPPAPHVPDDPAPSVR